ncbi:hypothetical protein L1887_28867 [Cichorium endivia]|nr:hypothetical protein L1887_28867 [Cichorium endivia]
MRLGFGILSRPNTCSYRHHVDFCDFIWNRTVKKWNLSWNEDNEEEESEKEENDEKEYEVSLVTKSADAGNVKAHFESKNEDNEEEESEKEENSGKKEYEGICLMASSSGSSTG